MSKPWTIKTEETSNGQEESTAETGRKPWTVYHNNSNNQTTAAQGNPAQPKAILPGVVKPSQMRNGVLTESSDGGQNAVRVVPKAKAPTARVQLQEDANEPRFGQKSHDEQKTDIYGTIGKIEGFYTPEMTMDSGNPLHDAVFGTQFAMPRFTGENITKQDPATAKQLWDDLQMQLAYVLYSGNYTEDEAQQIVKRAFAIKDAYEENVKDKAMLEAMDWSYGDTTEEFMKEFRYQKGRTTKEAMPYKTVDQLIDVIETQSPYQKFDAAGRDVSGQKKQDDAWFATGYFLANAPVTEEEYNRILTAFAGAEARLDGADAAKQWQATRRENGTAGNAQGMTGAMTYNSGAGFGKVAGAALDTGSALSVEQIFGTTGAALDQAITHASGYMYEGLGGLLSLMGFEDAGRSLGERGERDLAWRSAKLTEVNQHKYNLQREYGEITQNIESKTLRWIADLAPGLLSSALNMAASSAVGGVMEMGATPFTTAFGNRAYAAGSKSLTSATQYDALTRAMSYGIEKAGLFAMSGNAAANTYADKIGGGDEPWKALLYGLADGAAEFASELAFGGNPLLDSGEAGAFTRWIYRLTDNGSYSSITKTWLECLRNGEWGALLQKFISSGAFDMMGEGFEEIISSVGMMGMDYALYGKTDVTLESLATDFASGVLLSMVLIGGEKLIGRLRPVNADGEYRHIKFFTEEQQNNFENDMQAARVQMAEYVLGYLGGDVELLKANGMTEEQANQAAKDFQRILTEYSQIRDRGNAYYDMRDENGNYKYIRYFTEEQQNDADKANEAMLQYFAQYLGGDKQGLLALGISEQGTENMVKEFQRIQAEYDQITGMLDAEEGSSGEKTATAEQAAVTAEQTAAPVELPVDRSIFTPETAAEDAQSVVEAHRQMERDGTLQNRAAAEELLKTAETATVHVQNAEATGRLTAQQAYDSELALRQVIESAKTVLAQNNTPAQITTPETTIGGMENGRAESVIESQERQAVLGADESNRAVPEGTAARANRGRSDSYEIARAVNAGQVDRTSAKAEGIEHGSRNETMLILKDSVVDRIETLKSTRDEAAKNGMNIKFFSGHCEINRNGKTMRVEGVYNPGTNTYYVKADQITRNAEQIYRHETFHKMLLENPGMREYCVELLMEQYSSEELDRLVAQYYDLYKDLYGVVTEDMSADEREALGNKYLDELLADAYAGIRRGGINTVKAEQAMAAFRSDSGKENAAATDRTNGPGENKTAGTEDGGVQRYSAEDGVEETDDEEYKKPITEKDVQALRSIGRKSVNSFTSEDIKMTGKWAYEFFQELGTKSPFFRAWFGDWRAFDTKTKVPFIKVNSDVISRGEIPRGDYINRDTDWSIRSSAAGIDETASKSGKWSEAYHSLQDIDKMIENAVLLDTVVVSNPSKKLGGEALFMHHLYCPVIIEGKTGVAKLYVSESFGDERKFYLIKIEKASSDMGFTLENKGLTPDDNVTSDDAVISIAELFEFVKNHDVDFEKNSEAPIRFEPKQANPNLLNEDGTPRVFYHGTLAKGITEFKKEYIGSRFGADDVGFFFVDNKQTADDYATSEFNSERRGEVIAVYLCMENPLVFDSGYARRNGYGNIFKDYDEIDVWDDHQQEILTAAKKMNADGIIINDGRNRMAVTFDPTQAKHAEENIGTYDRGDSRLRYSVEDDAAELDEAYKRAVQRDAAEDEPTEKGRSFLPQRDAALGTDYAAVATEEIERRAKEASLKQLRQMLKTSEAELNRYRWAKRKGILTDEMAERMKTVEDTVKIQSEELKHKNAEERKQREKRQDEEARKQQPRIAKKELKATIAEDFHVAAGQRAITNDLIEQAANKILQRGYLDAEDKRSLFNALLKSGVVNIAPEGYYGEIRSYVQQGRIYVPESIREEFGDDWNDFKDRAFGNRIFLTTHTSDRGIDDWNADLAQMFPGGFEEGATDMKEALEQIVRLAEEGSAENITIAEMMERNRDNYGWSVENQMEQLEEKFDAALKSFAEKANVEIKARQEKATEVLKERRRMREMIERERNRKWESEQRNHVMKLLQQLNRMRKRSAPEIKAMIDEVLKDIDTVARSISVHGIENLIDLAKIYEAAKEDPNFIPNPYVEARLSRLQQTQLDDMKIEDVIELGHVVSSLVHSVQEANRLYSEAYKAEMDATARNFVEEMQATKGSKGGKLYEWAVNNHLSPVRLIRHLGGWIDGGASAQIAQSLENGQTRQMKYMMEASQIFDRFMSDKANRKWLETASGKKAEWIKVSVPVNYNVNENDQTEVEWKDIEITPMMRVALMMHSRNYDNLRHIMGGGMTIPNKAYYVKGDMQNAYAYGTRVKMSPETVRAIVKDCTPTERAFAKLLSDYYNNFSKERINEVSMKLDGFERAGGDNYYHIKVDNKFLSKLPDTVQKNISVESIGSIVNERVYAQTPIVLEDASVSLADHMKQISQYYGFAVPIHDYTAITNYTAHETGNAFSGSVKEVMGQKWGAGAEKYLNKLMEDLQSSTRINEMVATFLGKLRGNLAEASLINPSVVMTQAASYPGAMQTLGARALVEGLKVWERVDTDLIEKYSPLLWYRNQGNSTQELGDYMDGQTLEHKLPWLLGWIQKMDSATVRRLWAASEYYVKNNTDLRPGSEAEIAAGTDEYYQKVAEMFNRAVYDTQPNYSTMQRPQILRSNSDLTKFLTMFKTVPLQYYNMMFEATGRLTNAKRRGNAEEIKSAAGYFARTAVGLVTANAIYVAMKALFKVLRFKDKDYRDEEGKLTVESFMKQLGMDFIDTTAGSLIGGAELLEAIERIASGDNRRFKGIDINAFSFITDVVQDVKNLRNAIGELDGKDLASAIKGIVKDGVMGTLGLPAQNAETYLLALTKWISPETAERYENLFSDRSKSSLSEESGRYLEAAISVYMDNRTEDLPDEVKQELQRLWEAGQKNAIPSAVPSSVTVGGESIALTSAQKAQFREEWSRIVSDNLEALIGSEYYQSADDTMRGKLIDRVYQFATQKAKSDLDIGFIPDSWVTTADSEAEISLADYIIYNTEYKQLNGKNADGESESGLKDRRTLDLIDGYGWSNDQKVSAYLDNCSDTAAGRVKAMSAAGMNWTQIKTVLTADKPEYAVLEANISDNAKLKVLGEFCNEAKMTRYQTGKMFDVSFADYAEVMQNADADGNGSITQEEARNYVRSMALPPQAAAYLFQMVTDAKNGTNNPFSPTWGAEFYYEMHKNDNN